MDARRWLLGALVAVLAACRGGDDAYTVRLDLGPAIHALGDDDLDQSMPAEERILALGPAAIPALDAALGREDVAVRTGIVEALASMDAPEAAPLLLRELADSDAAIRGDAAMALRRYRQPVVEAALVRALADESPEVRRKVAVACGAVCRAPTCVDPLLARAMTDEPAVAWTARASLGRLRAEGGPTMADAVTARTRAVAAAALAGTDEAQRRRAAILLADAGDPAAAALLAQMVAERSDPVVRRFAIYAAGSVGDAGVVPPLTAALREPLVSALAYDALRRLAERHVDGAQAALDAYAGPRPAGPMPPPT